jgi:two-component system, LuxR family, sensor kinase FixL
MRRDTGKPDASRSDPPQQPEAAEAQRARAVTSVGELHRRLVQVSRLATIGEMSAGIAHELNQPLTAIANYAHACDRLLGRADADLADVRVALREIAAQAVRAADILRRLRALASSQPMQRRSTDINAVIEEIRELILADGRVHGARVGFELGAQLPRVSIDAAQIQHVILNLVRNGLEALNEEEPSRRLLHLRTRAAEDGHVEIAVLDTGPGLSPGALAQLFDPFFSTKSSGTGLGLAISNTVVRAHGGTLRHRPNVPRGACFDIRLPVEKGEPPGAADERRLQLKRE